MGKAKKLCTVYALCDSEGQIRYIGQTRNLRVRMKYYRKQIRFGWNGAKTPVERWLCAEKDAGRPMNVRVITDHGFWDVSEIVWIERAKASGYKLLNCTRGGSDTALQWGQEIAAEKEFRETGTIAGSAVN